MVRWWVRVVWGFGLRLARLSRKVHRLQLIQEDEMSAVDDLVAATSELRASYDALKARVDALIGAPPVEDPRIAEAVDALDAQKADQDAFHAS